MWHNRTKVARRILCKECELQTNKPVHKCDACQVVLLGPRIAGSPGSPGIPRVPRVNLVGMEAAKLEVDFSTSMWQHKSRSERRTLCKACEQKKEATVHKCDACQALFLRSWGPQRASASSGGLDIPRLPRVVPCGISREPRYPQSTPSRTLWVSGGHSTGILGYPEVLWQLLRDTP